MAGAFTSGHVAKQLGVDGEDLDAALAELRSRGRGAIVDEFNRAHSTTRDAVSATHEEARREMVNDPRSCGA